MIHNKIKQKIAIPLAFGVLLLSSCTKLDEQLNDSVKTTPVQSKVTSFGASVTQTSNSLLQTAYNKIFGLVAGGNSGVFNLEEITTDAAIAPTRGADWDDGGEWRALHNHTFEATGGNAAKVKGTFEEIRDLLTVSTDVINDSKSDADAKAEARFLRAYGLYFQFNFFGQIVLNSKVYSSAVAMDSIISEITTAKAALKDGDPLKAYVANKQAASALLMRCYLNRACLVTRSATPAAPSQADMNMVVTLADEIISSGKYKVNPTYFASFAPDNGETNTDFVFSVKGYLNGNNCASRWMNGSHYNMTPSGWNGFSTLGDFYSKFDDADKRRSDVSVGLYTELTGTRVGMLYGQQLDAKGAKMSDRRGNLLFFTKEIDLIEKTSALETRGIRVFKFEPDLAGVSNNSANNDVAGIRYTEVLLMKAEALLRGATASSVAPATAADILTAVGGVRGSTKTAATLENIYDERGRELYWEGLRRTDMIRFGKFLSTWPTKNKGKASDAKVLYFPIPTEYVKEGLTQNPGY